MRTLASFIMTTLDGFYEGPNGEFDWPVVDDEFNTFSIDQLDQAGALVFGRVTYEGMALYWTSDGAANDSPEVAHRMNMMPKFVVSTSLDTASWKGTTLIAGNLVDAMSDLKAQPGGELLVLGSPGLTASLGQAGVLDELRIMVAPVALGHGRSLFRSMSGRMRLHLLGVRQFASGNVLLTYRPS
jgi:dihydrofolate reductase